MNYRHAYHAGNFADVFKHIVLMRLVEYMKRKEKAFRVYDIHAGLGSYRLDSEEAAKTEEWKAGIGAVLDAPVPPAVAALIAPYLDAVKAGGDAVYPGSPRLVRDLLRKQDRLSLYELHPEDHAVLARNFSGDFQTRVTHLDGWLVAGAHVPPKEKRGLLLADPPFEDGQDFDRMVDLLQKCAHRWAGGTVALWYPLKRRSHTDDWLETLTMLKHPDLVSIELTIREPRAASMLNGLAMIMPHPL
ncbi:MAG: 23S rRNA (adenine(2030)-N(6))-methyltransferase RlmJ, partial [Pseudomonadota bacterium]